MTDALSELDKPCEFHRWRFDPTDGQLISGEQKHRLQPRIAKLLAVFLAHSGELLTRDKLIDTLWQDKMVNEDALSRCIAELRSTLGDESSSPIYIETVPKKGYRFLQPVKNGTGHLPFLLVLVISVIAGVYIVNGLMGPTGDHIAGIKNAIISAQRITTDDYLERLPKLSPSGQMIAYSVREDNRLVVRIINRNSDLLYTLQDSQSNLYSPVFAPDDSAVYLAAVKDRDCELYRYSLPELARERLTDCYVPSASPIIDISPDGLSMAYVAMPDEGSSGIWQMDLMSKERGQLTSPTAKNIFDTNPRFSQDGKTIAFTHGTSSAREIATLTLSKPESNIVHTNDKGWITSISWLNDNRHIIYDSDEAGDRNLWLLDTSTNDTELLGARDAQMPSLDAANSTITFLDVRYNANIWEVKLDSESTEPQSLIESIKYNNHPAYSPDGKHIAFTSNRKGKTEIWLYDIESGEQRPLLDIPGLNLFAPYWSGDSNHILVSSRGKTGYRCYQVARETGAYQPAINLEESHSNCIQTTQGHVYTLTKDPERRSRIIKVDQNGESTVVAEEEISRFELTDTDDLIYSHQHDAGIYILPADGSTSRLVLPNFNRSLDEYWTVRGQYIYYPDQSDRAGIWRYDLQSDTAEFVTEHIPSTIGLSLSVNHDHTKMLLSRTDNREADVYLGDITSKD